MRGKERRTTVSCRATIPKYIVEKILSQGGTGSAHPYRWAQLKRVRKFAPRVRKPDEPDKSDSGEKTKLKNKVSAGRERSMRMIHSLRQTEDKGASSVHFTLRLPTRTGASYIRCEKPFSSASCVSVARHGIVVLRSYT